MNCLSKSGKGSTWLAVLALATPLLLSSCGGGSNAGTAARSSIETAAPDQRAVAMDVTTTWVPCAQENQHCAFSGSREVRYGTATQFVSQILSGGTDCTNGVFGDPVVGTVKSCWYANQTSDPAPSPDWIACAQEWQFCTFSGTRAVRYGTGTSYYTGVYSDGVSCSNGVFGDPAWGIVKSCSYSAAVIGEPPVDNPGASGVNAPIVLNASATAHAGDVVSLQGENFGASPRVYFEGAPQTPLDIVNRVGTGWLAVQMPANAPPALRLRISNGTGVSARVLLNAARPLHLDTLLITPDGPFKVFGRNLRVAGSVPHVTVDGLEATVDVAHSDEYSLSVVAPHGIQATASAALVVDNGNGSGPSPLDRSIEVRLSGSGDPFSLGVGWGAGFSAIASTSIDASRDPRLAGRVVCDGSRDDRDALQAAIDLAAAGGGGVVRLPAGRCRLASGINLRSRVVVQGAGKAATELVYESNYPVYGASLDLAGMEGLTLTNSGSSTEGPLLKDSTRVFLRNVRVQLKTSRQMYLTGNRQFVVSSSDFVQTGSISGQGPYVLNDSAGLVFEGNTTRWVNGAPTFGRIHDSYVHANRFTRDGSAQNLEGTVHSFAMDFAHRIAVVGNTFDVDRGPITNKTRNDGETILTEGGGAARTENLGTVASATSTTLSDPSNTFQLDPFGTGTVPENYGVAIVGGKGAGQTRRVVSGTGSTLTVDRAWDIVPDAGSHYATFVWGLEKSLIKDNQLSQNPRGIWLYHTAVRDVAIVGNTISEGGGIYLRSFQNLATKSFMPHYNVLVAGNRVSNSTGQWMSYVMSMFVNADARAFGIATIGVEMRDNEITANSPNTTSSHEEYANVEGFVNMMRVENYDGYETSVVPRLLGAILTRNVCSLCDIAVRVGTGAGGTTVLNTRLVNSSALIQDSASTSTPERSTDTVVR